MRYRELELLRRKWRQRDAAAKAAKAASRRASRATVTAALARELAHSAEAPPSSRTLMGIGYQREQPFLLTRKRA